MTKGGEIKPKPPTRQCAHQFQRSQLLYNSLIKDDFVPLHPASPMNFSIILTCVLVSKRVVGVYPALLRARRRPLVTSNSRRKRRVAVRYVLSG